MNILLVDDNEYVLLGLKEGIDFNSIGIHEVYTALNARQAKEILSRISIQIMLTDIDMPQESGIELLEWVNENKLDVITMFCTSYADFNYAKKAVELHSFDYYLKPISYGDLSMRLEKAVGEVNKNNLQKVYQKYGQYWLDNQKNNQEAFWIKILHSISRPDPEEIYNLAAARKLNYKGEDNFILCILDFLREDRKLNLLTSVMKEFVIRNIIEEIYSTGQTSVEAVSLGEEDVFYIVLKQREESLDREAFDCCCREFIDKCNEYLLTNVNCYYYEPCVLANITEGYDFLERIYQDDVSGVNVIRNAKEYRKKEVRYQVADMAKWQGLLLEGKKSLLMEAVFCYLDERNAGNELNVQVLKAFRIDMMQMIHTVLKQKQIEAHRLYGDRKFDLLREKSLKSLPDMKNYLQYIVETAAEYMNFIEQSQTVVDKIKNYLEQHYDEDISRMELAKTAYLNSDYLARLFKKETGKSLNTYLLEKRIERAKEMLSTSDVSINAISIQVGYDNFSYFSRLFKEKTGYSPKDYRKRYQQIPSGR